MNDNKELGIYIHIPFCKQKCYYCDFVSYVDTVERMNKYIEKLKEEIINEKNIYQNDYNVTTIYIGGGTPSILEKEHIKDILDILKEQLKNNKTKFQDIEITIEVNPGTAKEEKLKQYKESGINRLSIGLQSTNDNLLKEIGRIHNYQDFLTTYNMAKKIGFENINIDLIIGLPNQTIKDLKNAIQEIKRLNPNHVSVYSLIVEEGTKIEQLLDQKILELPDEDLERKMYWYVKNSLELLGYNHYEISNFAKPRKESKHNLNCWEQKEYIGLGLAAHSYINGIRYGNTNNLKEYIETTNFQKIKNIEEEQTLEDRKKEYMLLGLRKIQGVSISKLKEKYIENPLYLFRNELKKLVDEGLIKIDLDKIKLTNKGLNLANIVWEEFI